MNELSAIFFVALLVSKKAECILFATDVGGRLFS